MGEARGSDHKQGFKAAGCQQRALCPLGTSYLRIPEWEPGRKILAGNQGLVEGMSSEIMAEVFVAFLPCPLQIPRAQCHLF